MKEPEEPDSFDPMLVPELEFKDPPSDESAPSESEFKESEEVPLEPEEESHGVIVVVIVTTIVEDPAAAPTCNTAARTIARIMITGPNTLESSEGGLVAKGQNEQTHP